jgi:hypothetical protein
MSMSRLRIKLLAATTLVAAATFAGGSAAWADVGATEWGTGPTAAAAESAAIHFLHDDYNGCGQIALLSDTQNSDGTWTAEISAVCRGFN